MQFAMMLASSPTARAESINFAFGRRCVSVGKDAIIYQCDVCDADYQAGPHRHEGHRLHLYGDVTCCDTCWRGNWDGWAPHLETRLLGHLQRQGLPVPRRLPRGLLPRD